MFPPYKTTHWCTKPQPDVVCDPVEWSVKVPVGKYTVKVTCGDSDKSVHYSLTVND